MWRDEWMEKCGGMSGWRLSGKQDGEAEGGREMGQDKVLLHTRVLYR